MPGGSRVEKPRRLSPDDEFDRLDGLARHEGRYPNIPEPEPDEPDLDHLTAAVPSEHVEVELDEPEPDDVGRGGGP